MILWDQKMDCEIGSDGGIIEVMYDDSQEWVNIFEDDKYMPFTIGDIQGSPLFNSLLGLSDIDTTWHMLVFVGQRQMDMTQWINCHAIYICIR